MISKQDLQAEHADVLGVVFNKVPKRDHAIVSAQLSKKLAAAGLPFAGGIPADPTIGTARLNEIALELEARLLYGSAEDMDCNVDEVLICAEDVSLFLERLVQRNARLARHGEKPSRPLVLTTKDRAGGWGCAGRDCLAAACPLNRVAAPVPWQALRSRPRWASTCCCRPSGGPLPLPLSHPPTDSQPHVFNTHMHADVLLSLTAAHVTGTGPHVAGIILTDAERGVG
jgi:hypothetical protein